MSPKARVFWPFLSLLVLADCTTKALALVTGGAIGNLLDRLQSARGVVDFIDAGVGAHRFWTFDIADAGMTVGAVLLAILLSQGERARKEAS